MYSQIASNKRKTYLIIIIFLALIVGIGYVFALYNNDDLAILPFVLIGAAVYALITYFAGSRLALAVNGAKEIQKSDNPRLWRIIENLSITDGLPMPRVFIMDDPSPNAFATGRKPDKAAVCATTGLLAIMDDDELQGVFAHELGHIKNYDIRVSMVVFALVAVVSIIADIMIRMSFFRGRDNEGNNNQIFFIVGIVAAILAPIIATLIQLAVSRKREYLADATGALTTRYPEGLISALQKIERTGSVLKKQNTSTAHFFFANPLKAHSVTNLFSTHPPIDQRIARLKDMETHA
ncbi:MAG TPA: M48 family metalloprotease [Candidatus Saccharimonadales bacterium]|nr:M48 family metalloprotease [Candidatus Saccharimonadales bacterium]